MKHSLTLATLLIAVACGKAGKIVEVPGPVMEKQTPNPVIEKQVASYTGSNLLISPDGSTSLILKDLDAQKAYEVLQVEEVNWQDGSTTSKTGKFIYCLKKDQIEGPRFNCSVSIDTKTKFLGDNGDPKEDKKAKHLDQDYKSANLEINQADGYVTLHLSGIDALKLYDSLADIPRVKKNETNGKVISTKGNSPGLRCIQTVSSDLSLAYSCDLVLNSLGWVATLKK